jgi:hypothetical protein
MKMDLHRSVMQRLDAFGRRHLWLTALLAVVLAVVATVALLGQADSAVILYEEF